MEASNEIVRLRGCLQTLHDHEGQADMKKTAEDIAHISLNEIDHGDLGMTSKKKKKIQWRTAVTSIPYTLHPHPPPLFYNCTRPGHLAAF